MSKGQTLQDPFLNTLRKDRIPVSIFLVNGIKLQGQIESFDQYVVLLKNTVSQMVYKHAISTVVPARNPRSATAGGTSTATPAMQSGYQADSVGGFDRGTANAHGGFASQGAGGFSRGTGFGEGTQRERGSFTRTGFQDRGGFDRGGFASDRGFDSSAPVPQNGFANQGGFGSSAGGFDRGGFDDRGFEKRGFDADKPKGNED